jgi:hypothetical protein
MPRPLLPEHGSQDLLLERVVPADHRVDACGGDDGHVVARDELDDAAVVIRVRVRHEHRKERLAERLEPRAESSAVRDGERPVDRNDPVARLDEVRVDERSGRSRRVPVDARRRHSGPARRRHAAASVGRP